MNRFDINDESPGSVVGSRLKRVAKDVAALAELQAELLQVDLRDWIKRCVVPVAILTVVAVTLVLASLPVLLLSLAYCLIEFAELSPALSMLIAALVGILVASICGLVAWRILARQHGTFTRFRIELARNVRWIKQLVTRPASADREAV